MINNLSREGEGSVTRNDLTRSEAKLKAILETAVEGIITIDRRGIIESINPAAQKMFGYHADELVGQNIGRLMPCPYNEEHDGFLARYIETGVGKIIGIGREVIGLRRDGSVFPMYLSVGEAWLDDREVSIGDFFGRALSGGLRGIVDAYRHDTEAELSSRNLQRSLAIGASEPVDEAEAGWLAERINRDGELHDAEKALLMFIKQESPDIHPALKPLLNRVA